MKAKELMIGDWYYDVSLCHDKDDPNDKNRQIARVGSIEHFSYDEDFNDIYRVNRNYSNPFEWNISQEKNMKPIPLTEEILKANGFEARGSNTFTRPFGKFFVVVELDYNDIEISKYFGIGTDDEECEYGSDIHFEEKIKVHELQHALRLCGLVTLADNFNVDYGNKY